MNNKKIYDWEFDLFERSWCRRGVACPDCVNESNYKVWRRFLDRAVRKLLRAETMETEEFRELLEEVREEEAQRLVWEKRAEKMAEARRRRSCMARPKIDYVPKGVDCGFGGGLRRVLQAGGGVSARKQHCNR